MVIFLADVELTTNDRLDALGLCCVVKCRGPKDISVVSDGHRRHVERLGALDQLLDIAGAIKQRIIRV